MDLGLELTTLDPHSVSTALPLPAAGISIPSKITWEASTFFYTFKQFERFRNYLFLEGLIHSPFARRGFRSFDNLFHVCMVFTSSGVLFILENNLFHRYVQICLHKTTTSILCFQSSLYLWLHAFSTPNAVHLCSLLFFLIRIVSGFFIGLFKALCLIC